MQNKTEIETIKSILEKSTDNNNDLIYNSPNFQKLKKSWYSKLKKKNFVDIEPTIIIPGFQESYCPFLSPDRAKYTKKDRLSTEKYYELCTDYLYQTTFDQKVDKVIWELHCNGQSYRQISASLRKLNYRKRTSIWYIHKIINHHLALLSLPKPSEA